MVWSIFWVIFSVNFGSNESKSTSSVNKLNLVKVSIASSNSAELGTLSSLRFFRLDRLRHHSLPVPYLNH